MPGDIFHFKRFTIKQDKCEMKVGTDAVLLGSWTDPADALNILDVGTGTGIIAIMLAQRSIGNITAIDIDIDSCSQAIDNVFNSPWKSRVFVERISFQEFVTHNSHAPKFDLIVSNPPYFDNSYKAPMEKRNVVRHTDLLPFNDLIDGVYNLLETAGKFCLILPSIEGMHFIKLANEKGLFCSRITSVRTKKDKKEKRLLIQFEKEEKLCDRDILTIEEDGRHQYTQEYQDLTRDYYINLNSG